MKGKKGKRFLALLMALVLTSGTNAGNWNITSDIKAVSADSLEEKAFKVTMDDKGYLTADETNKDLENQKFSWDNATVYFVLTDRFLNGDTSNDHAYGRGLDKAGKSAQTGLDYKTNPGTFHGGDLKGLTSKVTEGYFNDLGVNAIWITAPYEQMHGFTSGHVLGDNGQAGTGQGFPYYAYHGYWPLDHTNIDENMGTEADFETFVDECHKRGIRVVMDVVLNHTGYISIKDCLDLDMEDALNAGAVDYYYGDVKDLSGGAPESETWYNLSSDDWANKWWGTDFVRVNSDYKGYKNVGKSAGLTSTLCGLPDIYTEAEKEVPLPPHLKKLWTDSGRYEKETKELDTFFSKTGLKKTARNYVIKWLTDWVRDYGVDGFRCDTAAHVEQPAWKSLKEQASAALKEWRENHPDKPGANWTDDFWMTGESWGHGMNRDSYYDNGFDSMINFGFNKSGDPTAMEDTYSSYASAINSDESFNVLSYLTSHDDKDSTMGVWSSNTKQMINQGTCLLLAPGGVQIYYGNEVNRGLGWTDFFTGSEYLDQKFRTDMDWSNYDKDVLAHWQKVGQFRNKHLSVGGGQHEKLDGDAYTFSRTYHLEEDDEDKVVCCLPGKAGTYTVNVGDVFEDGETITDFYSGEKYEVSGGSVSATCDANGVILLEGSGIVKASVGAKTKNKAATYSSDTIDITLRANKAKDTYYSINGGEKKPYKADDVLTIGGDTAYEEKTTLTLTGISEDDGSELTKEFTYQRSKEPNISDGEFCVKCSKKDFTTAPNIYVYTGTPKVDLVEYAGAWPGAAMEQDEDSEYWSYKNEKVEGEALVIISTTDGYKSVTGMDPGAEVKGNQLFSKKDGSFTELPSGDPGKVTVKYVDQDGKELKSIYRVGVIGKKYTTYPAEIDGYTLMETPKNATGEFEEDGEVVYVYTNGDAPATQKPTPSATTKPDETVKPTNTADVTKKPDETEKPGKTSAPTPSIKPTATVKPSTQPTGSATVKPTSVPTNKPNTQNTEKPGTPTASVKPTDSTNTTEPSSSAQPSIPSDTKYHAPLLFTNVDEYYVGKNIRIEAAMLDNVPNCTYSFSVTRQSGLILVKKAYSTSSGFTWKPTGTGTYYIGVTVKDADGNEICSNQRTIKVVKQPLSLKSFKASKVSSTKVKVAAKANGGQGKVQYKFSVKAPRKKKVVIKKFSTKSTAQFATKKKGTYYIYLEMKDSSGVRILKTIKYKKK